jgi:ATP-dependent RNA helicase DeaD
MSSEFEKFNLLPQLVQAITQMGFTLPTPIQEAAIPALLSGADVMGQAQTGTGKTAAFALPLLQRISLRQEQSEGKPRQGTARVSALVMAPTRELALQVSEAIDNLARNTSLRVLAVYGGQPYRIQTRQLERGVDVVVGTPGRLLDLIRQAVLDLSHVHTIVLDEADEMLEMGFIDDVEAILSQTNGERQMSLFSATLPAAVRRLADRYLHEPQSIAINPTAITVAETEQRVCHVRQCDKLAALTSLLEVEDVTSALVFARTKAGCQELADELNRRGYPAEALHGDLNQSRREAVLNRFKQHILTLLVATDVAARGLDIENVSHVFNYDVPGDAEDYVHRIGRTGRAGRKGIAITLLTPSERGRLKQIEAFTRQPVIEIPIPSREELLARRDTRLLERLIEKLGKKKIDRERALIAKLSETSFDMVEIAAAAIQLARTGERDLAMEEIKPVAPEPRVARREARSRQPADGARYGDRNGVRDGGRIYAPRPERRTPAGVPESEGRTEAPRPDQEKRGVRPIPSMKEIAGRWEAENRTGETPRFFNNHHGEPGMVRLRLNLGETHGLRPSDVVGAIASEVGIPGRAIGVIDIHQSHTFVDVSEQYVNKVLEGSRGAYSLRGRPVLLTL